MGSWGRSSKKLGVDFPAMFEPTRCKRPTVSDSNEVSHVLPAALMSSGEFRNVLAVLRLKLAGRSQTEHRRINDLPLLGKPANLTAHDSISVYMYIHTHMGTYMALYHYLYIPIIHLICIIIYIWFHVPIYTYN